jgi:molybdenum cofactor cytidylyltransferase
MDLHMIVAVILSAGESSRMGRPKALLPIDGVRFVEKIVSTLKSTDVGNIIVVLGHNAEEIRRKISDLPVTILINHDYKQGQLSSLQVAIRHLESSGSPVDGILVHLVDHPYIEAKLVNLMIDRFYETKKLIVVPRFQDRRGHPVIFARVLFPELLAAGTDQGAKPVVHAHRDDTLEIDTNDKGVLIDIDTPEEYRLHVKGN